MAAITALTKDFDGTDGATAGTTALGASVLNGAGTSTLSAAHAVSGTTCWSLNCTNNNLGAHFPIGTSKALVWAEFYGTTPSSLPGAVVTLFQSYGDSDLNLAVGVQWMTDGGIRLRDNITQRANSTTDDPPNAVELPPNTDFRIAVKSNPGGVCRVKLYIGGNKNGGIANGIADYDSGDQANTSTAATGIDTIRLGAITNMTGTMFLDRLRGEDAVEPQPAVTVGKPTVNAGLDQTRDIGSGNFTLAGTESTVGGATVSTRAWTQLSGPPVTVVSGASTATVTLTALAATGTAVFQYQVTDSNAQSNTDTVTVAFVQPGIALVPVGVVGNTGAWVNQAGSSSNLWQAVDEIIPDFTDFIVTPQSPTNNSIKLRVSTAVAPTTDDGWSTAVWADVTTDASSSSLVVKVYDGDGTLKKTFPAVTTLPKNSPTLVPLSFTAAEVASFADWSDGIIVELLGTVT